MFQTYSRGRSCCAPTVVIGVWCGQEATCCQTNGTPPTKHNHGSAVLMLLLGASGCCSVCSCELLRSMEMALCSFWKVLSSRFCELRPLMAALRAVCLWEGRERTFNSGLAWPGVGRVGITPPFASLAEPEVYWASHWHLCALLGWCFLHGSSVSRAMDSREEV